MARQSRLIIPTTLLTCSTLYLSTFTKASEYITYSVSADEAELGPSIGYGLTVDKQWLRLIDPPELDYYYPVMLAKDFGIPLEEEEPLYANLVLASPHDACSQLTSKDKFLYKNKFVLAIRGKCSFVEKSLNIQKAGGRVAIIYDNDKESQILISMGDDELKQGKDVSITSYAMLYDDGKAIHDEIVYQKSVLEDSEISLKRSKRSISPVINDNTKNKKASPTPAKNFNAGQPQASKQPSKKPSDGNTGIFSKTKEAQPGEFDEQDKFQVDSKLESLKASDAESDWSKVKETLNEKKIEFELAKLFTCIAPLNVTRPYLMQPPWRVWHDEL